MFVKTCSLGRVPSFSRPPNPGKKYFQINDNDRYGCHCQMKDLVSQDYIDYQDGRDHFRYFGQPVDPLGKDSQKI